MATDQVNGNGSVSEEPMDTTEVTRSEHFPALLEAGLPQNVAEKLDELYVAAAAVRRYFVRAGDEVTLPFDNVIHDQDECERTLWLFSDSRGSAVKLFEDGQIHKAKSDRLRVTENCSLVIKKVTEEDAGLYLCIRSGEESSHSRVYLSVVTMTEHQVNDEVTLNCSVSTFRDCRHSVKWLLQALSPQVMLQQLEHQQLSIVTVVTVHIWTRAKGGKKRIRKNLFVSEPREVLHIQWSCGDILGSAPEDRVLRGSAAVIRAASAGREERKPRRRGPGAPGEKQLIFT
ncbi:hypothetical protein JOQ06_027792, partial [Pogonophryne albipinna]